MKHQSHKYGINARIGRRLRMIREQNDLTQQDLAQLAGTTETRVQTFETDDDMMTAEELVLFASALLTPVEFFFAGNDVIGTFAETELLQRFRQLPRAQQRALMGFVRDLHRGQSVSGSEEFCHRDHQLRPMNNRRDSCHPPSN